MNKNFSSFLKALACLAFFIALYPFVALKCGMSEYSDLRSLTDMALVVFSGFFGLMFGTLTERRARKSPVAFKLSCIPALVFPIAFNIVYAMILCEEIPSANFIIQMIICCTAFLFATFSAPKEYSKILSKVFLPLNICLFIFSRILEVFTTDGGNTLLSVIMLTVVFAITSIINNQANIDGLMERRRYDKKSLPKKIRYFNLGLLFIFFGIVLALMLLRKQIAVVIIFLKDVIVAAVSGIFTVIEWLKSLFIQDSSVVITAGEEGSLGVQDYSVVSEIILNIVFFGVIIFLAVKFRSKILRAIRDMFVAFFRFIASLIKHIPHEKKEIGEEYYVDTEEYINPSDDNTSDSSVREKNVKLKKMYRAYRKERIPDKKIRLGYALAVRTITEKYSEIEKSATPLEICEGFKDIFGEELVITTSGYNETRYDEQSYSGDFSAIDGLLGKLGY